jgi:pentatricopeptide repeat protein
MAAYSRVSDFKEVLSLFRKMQEAGIKPNELVLVGVLTACAHLGAVTQGCGSTHMLSSVILSPTQFWPLH